MMEMCIDAKALRAALADIEAAEQNGFLHCLAVMRLVQAGPMVSDNMLEYRDILERAHPHDERLDWGRGQDVSQRYKFEGGKLVPLVQAD